jgi:hypothetical protein
MSDDFKLVCLAGLAVMVAILNVFQWMCLCEALSFYRRFIWYCRIENLGREYDNITYTPSSGKTGFWLHSIVGHRRR